MKLRLPLMKGKLKWLMGHQTLEDAREALEDAQATLSEGHQEIFDGQRTLGRRDC